MATGSVLEEQPSAEPYIFVMCSLSVVSGRRAGFLLKLSPVPFASNRCCETAPGPTAGCVCLADLLLFIRNAFCYLSRTCLWFCRINQNNSYQQKNTSHLEIHWEDFSAYTTGNECCVVSHWFVLICSYVISGRKTII